MRNILIFIALGFILMFSSCKQTEYIEVPVETVKTEYIVKKDSVYLRDCRSGTGRLSRRSAALRKKRTQRRQKRKVQRSAIRGALPGATRML